MYVRRDVRCGSARMRALVGYQRSQILIPTDLTTQWKWSRWRSSERAANVTTLHSCHRSRCIARNVDPNAEVCGQNGYQTATVVFTSVTQKAYSRVEILPRSIGSQKVGVDVGAPGQRGNTVSVTTAAQPLPPNQRRTIDSPTLALRRTSLIFPPATKRVSMDVIRFPALSNSGFRIT